MTGTTTHAFNHLPIMIYNEKQKAKHFLKVINGKHFNSSRKSLQSATLTAVFYFLNNLKLSVKELLTSMGEM